MEIITLNHPADRVHHTHDHQTFKTINLALTIIIPLIHDYKHPLTEETKIATGDCSQKILLEMCETILTLF